MYIFNKLRYFRMDEVSEEEDDLTDDEAQGIEYTSLQMFLAATGCTQLIP